LRHTSHIIAGALFSEHTKALFSDSHISLQLSIQTTQTIVSFTLKVNGAELIVVPFRTNALTMALEGNLVKVIFYT
jgi:hypothetical protein